MILGKHRLILVSRVALVNRAVVLSFRLVPPGLFFVCVPGELWFRLFHVYSAIVLLRILRVVSSTVGGRLRHNDTSYNIK